MREVKALKHEALCCSCCGYIPDDEDIKKTNYRLRTCSCGQENVCDLCLTYPMAALMDAKPGDPESFGPSGCPVCSPQTGKLIGAERKFWLQDEYAGD